eukprot:48777_1
MAQFKGDSRDAKRARYGARVQEEMKEAFERKIKEMRDETDKSLHNMELGRMFSMDSSVSQQRFTNATVGLQTHEEYTNKAKIYLNEDKNEEHPTLEEIAEKIDEKLHKHLSSKQIIKTDLQRNCLSFGDEDEEEEEEVVVKPINTKKRKLDETEENKEEIHKTKRRKIIHKNPNVNTSFLPDPERDLLDEKLRNELELEWHNKQKSLKKQRLEITYSYWDGSGHRRSIEIIKGISIGQFLELVRAELSPHFAELRGITGDHLMYIKDDLIIPHSYLFYDLIVTDARGKSGHLMFKNQIYDKGDYVIDKDSGHPGKVITRSWYDRNKHIFPASRWELYDNQTQSKT